MFPNGKTLLEKSVIIIPIHNAVEFVTRTLESINLNYSKVTKVLVMDFCSEETVNMVRKLSDKTYHIIYLPRQQLFTRAINAGIRYSHKQLKPDYYLLVNSDIEIKENCFEALLEAFSGDYNLGIAGYQDTPSNEKDFLTYVEGDGYITGHCLCVSKNVFEKVGVFCETDLGGPYTTYPEFSSFKGLAHIGSDRHLSVQTRKAGLSTVYVNYPGCFHSAGKSWGHNLNWLSEFKLDPLWSPKNTL